MTNAVPVENRPPVDPAETPKNPVDAKPAVNQVVVATAEFPQQAREALENLTGQSESIKPEDFSDLKFLELINKHGKEGYSLAEIQDPLSPELARQLVVLIGDLPPELKTEFIKTLNLYASKETPVVGTTFKTGRFAGLEVIETISAGAQGHVYKAKDEKGNCFALKEIADREDLLLEAQILQRTGKTVESVSRDAQIPIPEQVMNAIPSVQYEDEDYQKMLLKMDWVDGEVLTNPDLKKQLGKKDIIRVLTQTTMISAAMAYAWKNNIDLIKTDQHKPGSIFAVELPEYNMYDDVIIPEKWKTGGGYGMTPFLESDFAGHPDKIRIVKDEHGSWNLSGMIDWGISAYDVKASGAEQLIKSDCQEAVTYLGNLLYPIAEAAFDNRDAGSYAMMQIINGMVDGKFPNFASVYMAIGDNGILRQMITEKDEFGDIKDDYFKLHDSWIEKGNYR